jgi:hypothetical protein
MKPVEVVFKSVPNYELVRFRSPNTGQDFSHCKYKGSHDPLSTIQSTRNILSFYINLFSFFIYFPYFSNPNNFCSTFASTTIEYVLVGPPTVE